MNQARCKKIYNYYNLLEPKLPSMKSTNIPVTVWTDKWIWESYKYKCKYLFLIYFWNIPLGQVIIYGGGINKINKTNKYLFVWLQ